MIAYFDNDNGDLKYARCIALDCINPVNWSLSAIDTNGVVGRSAQMKIGLGALHISYRDFTNQDLKYARCDLTNDCTLPAHWTFSRIDAPGQVGWDTYLAIRPSDSTIHFSYNHRSSLALKYAVLDIS